MAATPTGRFERYQQSLQEGHDELRQGRLKQALAAYKTAGEIGENRAQPHVLAASVLIRLGRLKDALAEYDKALAFDGNEVSAVAGKVGVLRALGRNAAAADFEKRLADLEEDAETQRLASAVAGAGGAESAEGLVVAAERMVAKGRPALAIKALLGASKRYADADHLDAAIDACLRALQADSGSPAVHLELARLYFRYGWNPRAVEHLLLLAKLLALAPNSEISSEISKLAAQYSNVDDRLANVLVA